MLRRVIGIVPKSCQNTSFGKELVLQQGIKLYTMRFFALFMCISLKTCATASVDEPGPVFSPQSKVELKDAVDACVDFVPEGNSENPSLLEEYEKKFSPADPAEIKELNQELDALGLSSARIQEATRRSIERPTEGFDEQFGRSAIKAYRAFLYPKKNTTASFSAKRCAHQVNRLVKEHKSREAAGIRDADSAKNVANGARNPLILLLDNLRSAFNVGSLFRTADACACKELVTTRFTPHPGGGGAEKVNK